MERIVAFVLSVILASGCLILIYGNHNFDKSVSNKIAESTIIFKNAKGKISNFASQVNQTTDKNNVTFFVKETFKDIPEVTRLKNYLYLVRTIQLNIKIGLDVL